MRRSPSADIGVTKARLRRVLLARLRAQKEADRQRYSRSLERALFTHPEFRRARTVLFYVPLPYEVDTSRMIDRALALGKRVCVPVTRVGKRMLTASALHNRRRELVVGPYGVRQPAPAFIRPVDPATIDLAVVPGVGFDAAGRRLGHGLGYYDRFLRRLPSRAPRIGLAFPCQLVPRVPHTTRDAVLTAVLTA